VANPRGPTARGEFVTTCYDNGSIGRMSADGTVLPAYTHDKDGNKFLGPNDLAPDARGGIYFSASGHSGRRSTARCSTLPPTAPSPRSPSTAQRHGLAVSADGRILYVVETEEHRLLQFSIAADGTLTKRRVFVNLDELTHHAAPIWPDGVKVSSKGEIYIGQSPRDLHAALLGQIFVLNAQGGLLRTLTLPSPKVPNLAFSPDEKTIYVTALDQIDRPPTAEGLFHPERLTGTQKRRCESIGRTSDRAGVRWRGHAMTRACDGAGMRSHGHAIGEAHLTLQIFVEPLQRAPHGVRAVHRIAQAVALAG